MKKSKQEIGLAEIAILAGVHRQTAYQAVKSGEIAGGYKVAGKLWVAPRGEVMKYARRRKRDEELRRQAAEDNPIAAAVDQIREGFAEVGAIAGDVKRRLTND